MVRRIANWTVAALLTTLTMTVTGVLAPAVSATPHDGAAGVAVDGTRATASSPGAGGSVAAGQPGSTSAPSPDGELTELRTDRSRTFLDSDGSLRAVVYPRPVHYRDAGGTWRPIDGTLSTGPDAAGDPVPAGFAWQNRANAYRVALPGDISAPLRCGSAAAATGCENDNPIWPHCDALIWPHPVLVGSC